MTCVVAIIESTSICFLYVSFSLSLVGSIIVFWHVWLLCHVWKSFWWSWRLVFVYTSCPSHVSTYCTYTQSCKHFHASVIMVVHRSIPSVALVTFSSKQSHKGSCFPLLSQWSVFSCFQSMLSVHNVESSQFHLPLTLGHFPENLSTKQPHFTKPWLSCIS